MSIRFFKTGKRTSFSTCSKNKQMNYRNLSYVDIRLVCPVRYSYSALSFAFHVCVGFIEFELSA
jgi:hypothetical protein